MNDARAVPAEAAAAPHGGGGRLPEPGAAPLSLHSVSRRKPVRRPGVSGPSARGQPSRGGPLPVSGGGRHPLTGGRGETPGPQGS